MKAGLEYIKYRWKAKGRHGIHSPFVYDITDKLLPTLVDAETKRKLNNLFNTLKTNNKSIEIRDFGAGSKRLGKTREIASIFNTSSSKGKYGELLYKLTKHFQPQTVLEFGTSLGIGSACMHFGNPKIQLTTVEACPETRKIALENFKALGIESINSVESTFDDYLKTMNKAQYDMVFIDGHHDGNALLDYIERLRPYTHDETIFVLDDIRWSDSMHNAWNRIVESSEYNVTLDFFRVGLAFRRPQQEKEHFLLRL